MNKKEKGIVKQLRDLVANPPPQVRNLKWFWSLQDLMAKFDEETPEKIPKIPDPEITSVITDNLKDLEEENGK